MVHALEAARAAIAYSRCLTCASVSPAAPRLYLLHAPATKAAAAAGSMGSINIQRAKASGTTGRSVSTFSTLATKARVSSANCAAGALGPQTLRNCCAVWHSCGCGKGASGAATVQERMHRNVCRGGHWTHRRQLRLHRRCQGVRLTLIAGLQGKDMQTGDARTYLARCGACACVRGARRLTSSASAMRPASCMSAPHRRCSAINCCDSR